MKYILALIPEPWASAILAGALLIAYTYGNVTGKGTERLKNTVANLTAQNEQLTKDYNAAISIQTAMALRVSEVRAENIELARQGADLEKRFSTAPGGKCVLSDADRLSIKSIRIGRKANPSTR